jgi:hypothetical protein
MKVHMGAKTPENKPERRTQTFREVRDFLSVPAEEIGLCLSSFGEWLHRAQAMRRTAEREGKNPGLLDLTEFTWHARSEPSSTRPSQPHPASTDIRDLGVCRTLSPSRRAIWT